jgi:hypothetical protein
MIEKLNYVTEGLKQFIDDNTVVFSVSYNDSGFVCSDVTGFTKKQIRDKISALVAEYEAKEYQRQRALEYPSIGNQLDMLWHAIDAGTLNKTSDFYTTLKAVKDANPKAE